MRRGIVVGGAFLVVVLLLPSAALADWLVMKDGARVETRGPWKVRGAIVVFTQPNGTLSSIRVREVDLDKSAEATAERKAEATLEPPPPPPEVRHVIDNSVVGRAPIPVDTGASDDAEPEKPASLILEVSDWTTRDLPNGAGIEVLGTLTSLSMSAVSDVGVRVKVVSDGKVIIDGMAFVDDNFLLAGRSTRFRMPVPDIWGFERVSFEVQGTEVLLNTSEVD